MTNDDFYDLCENAEMEACSLEQEEGDEDIDYIIKCRVEAQYADSNSQAEEEEAAQAEEEDEEDDDEFEEEEVEFTEPEDGEELW